MRVKVIGRWQDGKPMRCAACIELKKLTRAALDESGMPEVAVEDCASEDEYNSYGVVAAPVLMINGKMRTSGKVPPKEMIKELLKFELEKEKK